MLVIGIAVLMSLVGLSPALGTFLAGVVLANSEYRHELESDIDPFKGLLLGLFFMTVGAGINFALLFENFGAILGLTLGLIAVKAFVLLILARIFRLEGADKWLFGLGLAQAGEFGFVLLSFTVANGVLPPALADQLLLVVALSMLLTPGLFILYDKVIAPRYSVEQERDADEMPDGRKIIIAGAGRVGGVINRVLAAAQYDTTVMDYSSHRLEVLKRFGLKHYFGDASRPDLLHAAGIAEARVLIVAIDDREKIDEIVKYVSLNFPKVHIIARAMDRDHVYDLWAYGCRDIIRETYDSSLRMSRSVLEALGHDRETADKAIRFFDEADRKTMIEMSDAHEVGVPLHQNDAFVARVRERVDSWQEELHSQMAETLKK
jgi:CPA2 family monovalent cation:H+ antiporter-2